jgi:DNA recombination protein RmuC
LSTKRRAQDGLSDLQSSLQTKLEALDHGQEHTERGLRDEISRNRDESGTQSRSLREELRRTLKGFDDSVMRQISDLVVLEKQQLDSFSSQLGRLTETNEQKIEPARSRQRELSTRV